MAKLPKLPFKFDYKKINWAPLKNFLIARGEKLALGLAVLIGTMLVVNGLIAARKVPLTGTGENTIIGDIAENIKKIRHNIDTAVYKINADQTRVIDKWYNRDWVFPLTDYFQESEKSEVGRINPEVVPMPTLAKKTAINFLVADVLAYDIDTIGKTATVIEQGSAPRLPRLCGPRAWSW